MRISAACSKDTCNARTARAPHPKLQEAKKDIGRELQRRDREPDKLLEACVIAVPLAHMMQLLVQLRLAVA